MTPAERQAVHRRRQREAMGFACVNPEGADTATLAEGLFALVVCLEDSSQQERHKTAKRLAARALGELCSRYGIKAKTEA